MNSVQRRLQLGLAISLVLLMGLLLWVGSAGLRKLSEDFIASRLEHDAESLLAVLEVFVPDRAAIDQRLLNPAYSRAYSGRYFVLRLAGGEEIRSRSLWDQTLTFPEMAPGASRRLHLVGPAKQALLVLVSGYRKHQLALTIAVAEDLTPLERDLALIRWSFAGAALVVLVVLLVVQRYIVRRGFRQLDAVRADVRRLEHGEITALPEVVPIEVLPLVQEFNRLLVLLGQRMERSRNALGNLAHALKGPLSLLIQQFSGEELRDHPALREQMNAQAERIRQLMERELKRARVAGAGTPGRRIDLAKDLPHLLEVVRKVHSEKALDADCELPRQAVLALDREDMLELLGNLLDNAAKWARTRILCRVTLAEDVLLEVEDDGPGCSEVELAQLARRGARLDESAAGHGLGLAISKDIVTLYGGAMRFDRSPTLGGFRVRASLPISESHSTG